MTDLIPIPHQGCKPDWLEDDATIHSRHWSFPLSGRQATVNWFNEIEYLLPADHWAAAPLRAGLTPWNPALQGDGPPADWNGSTVLLRGEPCARIQVDWPKVARAVIGYEPTTPDQQAEGESGLVERLREVDWSGKADGKPCDRGTTCWHRNPDGPEAANYITVLEQALQTVAGRMSDIRYDYERNGPQWTGKDGHEYTDMSYLLELSDELGAIAAAALRQAGEGV